MRQLAITIFLFQLSLLTCTQAGASDGKCFKCDQDNTHEEIRLGIAHGCVPIPCPEETIRQCIAEIKSLIAEGKKEVEDRFKASEVGQ